MYANESKGERFPRIHIWFPPLGDDVAAAPFLPSVYPEYLTDPSLLICPSDPNDTLKDIQYSDGSFCVYVNSDDETQGPPGSDENGCSDDADASYGYLGWILDRVGDGVNDPKEASGAASQFMALVNKLAIALGIEDFDAIDSDIDLSDYLPGLGNAGGNTIYRLREGIERFLITDINNPAASARAQSETAIMHDALSTEVRNYNHLPGGSNVLYLDGHVKFIRYPGEQPISKAMAIAVGEIFD